GGGQRLRAVAKAIDAGSCLSQGVKQPRKQPAVASRGQRQMAVSGCTRECAEAQGKDIGVIATDKGWNLYVCGNGGMKPRHA
ncbi:hypothetical protein, partial [Klebsiella pneumoniae]|uniref:hypothetical protein n=1 Tax=Klebsiella pneumoniae TaxID=573 RepID=UPI0035B5BAD9